MHVIPKPYLNFWSIFGPLILRLRRQDECVGTIAAWTNVPNPLDHLYFINLDNMQNYSFLGCVEVERKDGLRVAGGWFHENNATLWLHLASWNLLDSQLS